METPNSASWIGNTVGCSRHRRTGVGALCRRHRRRRRGNASTTAMCAVTAAFFAASRLTRTSPARNRPSSRKIVGQLPLRPKEMITEMHSSLARHERWPWMRALRHLRRHRARCDGSLWTLNAILLRRRCWRHRRWRNGIVGDRIRRAAAKCSAPPPLLLIWLAPAASPAAAAKRDGSEPPPFWISSVSASTICCDAPAAWAPSATKEWDTFSV